MEPIQPGPGLARFSLMEKGKTTRTAICAQYAEVRRSAQRPVRQSWASMIWKNLLGRNAPEFSEQLAKLRHGIIDESP